MEESVQHADRLAGLGADNRAHCFAELRREGGRTLAELTRVTGLSRPTVRGHLESLVEAGLVDESARGTTSRGGRPAASFSLNPGGAYLAVFDVSKHEHRFLLCDLAGTIRSALVTDVDADLPMAKRTELIDEGLRTVVSGGGVDWPDVSYFSGSVGAQVDSGGAVVRNLGDVALLDRDFTARFDAPVTLENDLKAACYAEHRIGCAQGVNDVVYALAWHQVAAGIVLDGRIRRGVHELAGELNRVASTNDLPAEYAAGWRSWPAFLDVLQAADRDEQRAAESMRAFCAKAAQQLAMLAMAIDPEMIVLGGPLVHRSATFVAALEEALALELRVAPSLTIKLSALQSWGPALGATLRGLEAIESQLVGGPSFAYQLRNATEVQLPLPNSSEARTAHAS